jgi:hypothetical protein
MVSPCSLERGAFFFFIMTGVFTATAFLSDGISARCGYASTMGYPPGESYSPRDGIFSS